jgi:hypothetical protein
MQLRIIVRYSFAVSRYIAIASCCIVGFTLIAFIVLIRVSVYFAVSFVLLLRLMLFSVCL